MILALRRAWWRRRVSTAPFVEDLWARLPPGRTRIADLPLLACDVETSGLDAAGDELLSIGWAPIDGGELALAGLEEHRIVNRRSVGVSATIHGLRDCDLRGGTSLEDAFASFAAAARGRVLVFHHARLDLAFLDRVALALIGAPLLLPVLDTMRIEARRLRRRNRDVMEGGLRLGACRERYGLGPHRSHSATGDALAAGELFLAQVATAGKDPRYRDMR